MTSFISQLLWCLERMTKSEKEVLVLFLNCIIETQDGIHIPDNTQPQTFSFPI